MNRRTRMLILTFALSLVLPMLALADESLPAGTTIRVTTDQSISSKDAKVGLDDDTFNAVHTDNEPTAGAHNRAIFRAIERTAKAKRKKNE